MRIEMKLKTSAVCPKDGETITMDVEIVSRKLVFVEEVWAAIDRLTKEPVYQEQFTMMLQSALGDVDIVTRGTHSGVEIKCWA
jgi:hypothetical protein